MNPPNIPDDVCKGYGGGGIIYFHTLSGITGITPSSFEADGETSSILTDYEHGGGGGN